MIELNLKKELSKTDAAALCNIGYCFEKGEGVVQNYSNAIALYQMAAEAGNGQSMNNLA